MISNKLQKAAWCLKGVELPVRKAPAYFNFCVHAEVVYDDIVYKALLQFSKDFLSFTGKKMAICVSTPISIPVRDSVMKKGLLERGFISRVLELSRFAEIGYHGHFYRKGSGGLEPISGKNYDEELVISQVRQEMAWLKNIGVFPKVYVSGCWFLTRNMVLELEKLGIEIDVSIRRGKTDTFGGTYIDNSEIPDYGRPFILPPSSNILEIQSIFGPVMPKRLMKGHLSGFLKNDTSKNMFFIFPLHDWDIPRYHRNISANISELSKAAHNTGWMDFPVMRDMCFEKKMVGR